MSLRESARQAALIAWKDLQSTLRSKVGIGAVLATPLIMMVLLGYVFPSVGAIEDIPFAIVNEDEQHMWADSPSNVFLARFIEGNARTEGFDIVRYSSEDAARTALRSKDVRGVLIVPPGFSDSASAGLNVTKLVVLYDQSSPSLGRLVAGEAARIVGEIGAEDARENVREATRQQSDGAARAFITPYETEVRAATVAAPSYFQFLAPGLMTLTAVSAVMSGLPSSFNTEKVKGTLDSLLVAPIGRWTLIAGKVGAQVVRGAFQATALFLLAILIFGVTIAGSLGVAMLILMLTILSFVGVGVLLTSLVASDEGTSLSMLFFLPALLLSGVVFPIEQLPTLLQWVSRAIPLTYAVDAMRKVMILGAGLDEVLPEILILAAFGVVSFAFAGRLFSRAFTR